MTKALLFSALVLGVFTMAAAGFSPPYANAADSCGGNSVCIVGL